MQTIQTYGRFAEPILKRLLEKENAGEMRARISMLIESTGAETG